MDKQTLEALKGSIEKWRKIEAGEGMDRGFDNCPLCGLFWFGAVHKCIGCPVYDLTERTACYGTPYHAFSKWTQQTDRYAGHFKPLNPKVHKKGVRLARAEREFLESLLPEDPQP